MMQAYSYDLAEVKKSTVFKVVRKINSYIPDRKYWEFVCIAELEKKLNCKDLAKVVLEYVADPRTYMFRAAVIQTINFSVVSFFGDAPDFQPRQYGFNFASMPAEHGWHLMSPFTLQVHIKQMRTMLRNKLAHEILDCLYQDIERRKEINLVTFTDVNMRQINMRIGNVYPIYVGCEISIDGDIYVIPADEYVNATPGLAPPMNFIASVFSD